MRLGFACHWDPEPQGTWSGTPWRFREALAARTELVDLGPSLSAPLRGVLKATHARRQRGRWSSTWKHSRVTDLVRERMTAARARSGACDAVLEIQDLAAWDLPFFLYQDLSYDALLEHFGEDGAMDQFPGLTRAAIERRRERQRRVYATATGVLAMSAWLADSLVRSSEVPASKVFTVHPGINAVADDEPLIDVDPPERAAAAESRPHSLLFVGKDFHRKGGDLAVAALTALRAEHEPGLTLTIAGPATWPLGGPPPDGVRFLGRVPPSAVPRLMSAHDLFVLPSRFEAFGIVFAEALSRGLPCVARDAFAMPEIVCPGRNGALIPAEEERPSALAEAIVRVLGDPGIKERCAQDREAVRAHYSWDRAADTTLETIGVAVRD